jgi:hypothetical protein
MATARKKGKGYVLMLNFNAQKPPVLPVHE